MRSLTAKTAIAAALSLTPVAFSQIAAVAPEVGFTFIAGPNTQVKVLGNRPGLHGGKVAFYGYRGSLYATDHVIAVTPADGNGPYAVLVKEGDPRPDIPGAFFDAFGNPAIYRDKVVFLGDDVAHISSTYIVNDLARLKYFTGGIPNPFAGPFGVTSPASHGISATSYSGGVIFAGTQFDPNPCGPGLFSPSAISGLFHVSHARDIAVWPARLTTLDYIVAAYDFTTGTTSCAVTQNDAPSGFGPFQAILQADTDGDRIAFLGSHGGTIGQAVEGVFLRNVSGSGPTVLIAYTQMPAPGGGNFGGFDQITVDGDYVFFEACAGGPTNCARRGLYGCVLKNGQPGPLFEIISTDDMLNGLSIQTLNFAPTGHDGNQLAFDVRHNVQAASLFVATVVK